MLSKMAYILNWWIMKNNKQNEFIDFLDILSRKAIFNMIDTVRNTGKTTKAKFYCIAKFLKKRRKSVWVRAFSTDLKETKKDFISTRKNKFIDLLNEKKYNVTTENFKVEGSYLFYYENGKKIDWIIKFVYLSQSQSIKGNEIPEIDTIIFDEYRLLKEKYSLYRGNFAKDFFNLYMTIKRNHRCICFLLGNKEFPINIIANAFKIDVSEKFEGTKNFKKNSITYTQINIIPKEIDEDEEMQKVKNAFEGTEYYEYLFEGAENGVDKNELCVIPKKKKYYCGFCIDEKLFSLWYDDNQNFYFCEGCDTQFAIFVNKFNNKFSKTILLKKSDKSMFSLFLKSYKLST